MTTKQRIEEAANAHANEEANPVLRSMYPSSSRGFMADKFKYAFEAGAEFGIALEKAKAEKLVKLIKLRWPRYIESPISESIELVERTSFLAAMKLVEDYESEEG